MKLGIIYNKIEDVSDIIYKLDFMNIERHEMKNVYSGFINDCELFLIDSSDSITNISIETHILINDYDIFHIIIVGQKKGLIDSVFLSNIINSFNDEVAYLDPNLTSTYSNSNNVLINICNNLYYDYGEKVKDIVSFTNMHFSNLYYINEVPFISIPIDNKKSIIDEDSFSQINSIYKIIKLAL